MAGIFFRRIFGQYRYYIVILLGAVVGSLMANLVIDDITDKIGMFNEDFNNAIMSVSLIPQYIIYAIAVFLMVSYIEKRMINIKKTVIVIFISLIFLIAGILYEAYISPFIIRWLFEHISYCI